MSEVMVQVDQTTKQLLSWMLGVGSIVTGALLIWIASTVFSLAQHAAVSAEQLRMMREAQTRQSTTTDETARNLREIVNRVRRLEEAMERRERRETE